MRLILACVGALALLWIVADHACADLAGAPGPYLPGDTDRDGDVDIFDVANIQLSYGALQGMSWGNGDFDGDRDVDIFDIAMMQTNYGASYHFLPAPEPGPEPATNPEPSAFLVWGGLIGLSAGAGWWRSRKRRS